MLLNGEVDNGGCATKGGCGGAGFKIIRAVGAAERHVEVRVGIDATRNDPSSASINNPRTRDIQVAPNGHDTPSIA
jgi:hypothetical protein